MKKIVIALIIVISVLSILFSCNVYASNGKEVLELQDYIEAYGDQTYGFVAYVLSKVRFFSIPLCFLGIAISAIYQYVIGIRRLDTRYKGFYALIAFITILIVCQVLPFIFVVVVKFGRS